MTQEYLFRRLVFLLGEVEADTWVHTQSGISCTLDMQHVHSLVSSGCHGLCVCVALLSFGQDFLVNMCYPGIV